MSKTRSLETDQWYSKKEPPSAHAARQSKRISLSDLPDSGSLEHAWKACLKKRPYSGPPAEISYRSKISAPNARNHPRCIPNYAPALPSSNTAKSNAPYQTKGTSGDPSPDAQQSRYQQNFDGTHAETQPIWLPYRPGKVSNNKTSAVESNNRDTAGKGSHPHSVQIPRDGIIPSLALSAVDQPKDTELSHTSRTTCAVGKQRSMSDIPPQVGQKELGSALSPGPAVGSQDPISKRADEVDEMFFSDKSRFRHSASPSFFAGWTTARPDPSRLTEMGTGIVRSSSSQTIRSNASSIGPNFDNMRPGDEDSLFLESAGPKERSSFFIDRSFESGFQRRDDGSGIDRSNSLFLPIRSSLNAPSSSDSFLPAGSDKRGLRLHTLKSLGRIEEDKDTEEAPQNDIRPRVMTAQAKSVSVSVDDVPEQITSETTDIIPKKDAIPEKEVSGTESCGAPDDRTTLPSHLLAEKLRRMSLTKTALQQHTQSLVPHPYRERSRYVGIDMAVAMGRVQVMRSFSVSSTVCPKVDAPVAAPGKRGRQASVPRRKSVPSTKAVKAGAQKKSWGNLLLPRKMARAARKLWPRESPEVL